MNFVYPAIFRKTSDGKFYGFFPDLDCCQAFGDTLEEAVDNANAAAYDWLSLELSEDDAILPSISDESDLALLEGDIVRNISVHIRFYEGWDE